MHMSSFDRFDGVSQIRVEFHQKYDMALSSAILTELKGYTHPPDSVHTAVQASLLLVGKPENATAVGT